LERLLSEQKDHYQKNQLAAFYFEFFYIYQFNMWFINVTQNVPWSCKNINSQVIMWAIFTIFWYSYICDYPQEALVKFGCRSESKAENLKNPTIYMRPAGTYCLSIMISGGKNNNPWNLVAILAHLFHKNALYKLDFSFVTYWWKFFPEKKYHWSL
jgi:hypothetical protein